MTEKQYKKPHIAFVVQRYGPSVVGGSETYARDIAERMAKGYDVEVLTTCAKDYTTWKNEFPAGEEIINDVMVRRFRTDYQRKKEFDALNYEVIHNGPSLSIEKGLQWMKAQGPYSSSLIKYIKENRDNYDLFIFITYLYCTTFFGISEVYDKAILIPTAHDEPPIYLKIFDDIFKKPKSLIFLTTEEKEFVLKRFGLDKTEFLVIGSGINVPGEVDVNIARNRFALKFPYILYVGRIDESKGCKQLFDFFIRYKQLNPQSELRLALVGKAQMEIPKYDDIIYLGFVTEEEKYSIMSAATVLVLPSEFESLSIVTLEALAVKTPVLVNGKCDVLKGHCIKGNAGLYFEDYLEFEECLNYFINNKDVRRKLGDCGRRYVLENYSWEVIEGLYKEAIDRVIKLVN